jgi:hypothetical protein
MEGNNHAAQNVTLIRDYVRLDVIVVNQEQQIKQLKEELQQTIKEKNEAHGHNSIVGHS